KEIALHEMNVPFRSGGDRFAPSALWNVARPRTFKTGPALQLELQPQHHPPAEVAVGRAGGVVVRIVEAERGRAVEAEDADRQRTVDGDLHAQLGLDGVPAPGGGRRLQAPVPGLDADLLGGPEHVVGAGDDPELAGDGDVEAQSHPVPLEIELRESVEADA